MLVADTVRSSQIFPSLRAFNPDVILVSLGLDGGKNDIGNKKDGDRNGSVGLDLGREDYMWITTMCREIAEICCDGRIVVVLEGGYGKWKKNTASPEGENERGSTRSERRGLARGVRQRCLAKSLSLSRR